MSTNFSPEELIMVSDVLGDRNSEYRSACKHYPQSRLCQNAKVQVMFTRKTGRGDSCLIMKKDVGRLTDHLDTLVKNMRSKKRMHPPPFVPALMQPQSRLEVLESKIDIQSAMIKRLLMALGEPFLVEGGTI